MLYILTTCQQYTFLKQMNFWTFCYKHLLLDSVRNLQKSAVQNQHHLYEYNLLDTYHSLSLSPHTKSYYMLYILTTCQQYTFLKQMNFWTFCYKHLLLDSVRNLQKSAVQNQHHLYEYNPFDTYHSLSLLLETKYYYTLCTSTTFQPHTFL